MRGGDGWAASLEWDFEGLSLKLVLNRGCRLFFNERLKTDFFFLKAG